MIEFIQNRVLPSRFAQLFIRTSLKWQQDNCAEMGAALAYYALFSLFPIVLIILSVVGAILGTDTDVYQQILIVARQSLPPDAYEVVETTLVDLNRSSVGAGLVGFGLLMFTASSIFNALDRAVDKIWNTQDQPTVQVGFKGVAWNFVKDKILAFTLVLGTAGVLLLSLLSNIVIKIIVNLVNDVGRVINWVSVDQIILLRSLELGISFFLLTAVVMGLFKILPSAAIKWQDIWLGAMMTVALLIILQRLVGTGVVSIGEQFRAYGVIGSVMVLLLWIYLTIQIFFLGCEFSYVYSHLFGSRQSVRSNSELSMKNSK